jgi:O-antigen ligase
MYSSITDGEWIIYIGTRGFFGVVSWFAILAVPVVKAWRGVKKIMTKEAKLLVAILAVGVATHAVDMLPNSAFNGLLFFFAGNLVGAVRALQGNGGAPASPGALAVPAGVIGPR